MRISIIRSIVFYFLILLGLLAISPILDSIIWHDALSRNEIEETYEKDFGMGYGYVIVSINVQHQYEYAHEVFYRCGGVNSYTFKFQLSSSENVDIISLKKIYLNVYKNEQHWKTKIEEFEEATGYFTGFGGEYYTIDFHDNITAKGYVIAEFNVQGNNQNETFYFETTYEYLEPSWFETYGVLFIILIQLVVVIILGLIIYIINKRKINRDNLS
ncbi:MAG: hypothetical protein KAX33_03700 [Candidatus Lokiarchaeota archaeon]|nr:hypothetical protein [Candidatus Lokiarchaeota archaeon]